MELKELAKMLSAVPSPSGFEDGIRETVRSYLLSVSDEIKTDAMGNIWAVRYCGIPDAPKIMMDAHIDEIGFVITGIEDGFLKFSALGGVDARMLPAREVRILSDTPLFGIIDTMPVHILSADDMDEAVKTDKLRIDIGMTQENAEKAVPVGTPVVYASGCSDLGERQICGKALDDRACAAIIIKAFERLKDRALRADLYCLLSTQEEVGCRGAETAAWSIAPDYAVVVDVTHAKTPDAKDVLTNAGKGVAIGVGPNMNRHLTDSLIASAGKNNIPYQIEVCPGGDSGTNASVIQISGAGVSTALLSLPVKYMHTPLETADVGDMEAVCDLLVCGIEELEV